MGAEGQADTMASDVELHMEQRCEIELLHVEKVALIDVNAC